ncbi:MAG: sulfatase-modifying factor protein, partial [Saprospiraceae bacterium]
MRFRYFSFFCILYFTSSAQVNLLYQKNTLQGIQCNGAQPLEIVRRPIFSIVVNGQPYEANNSIEQLKIQTIDSAGQYQLVLSNISKDTLIIKNIVPFTEHHDQVYITGLGDHTLSRTHLFIPFKGPVNIIVPDNAWNLGYASIKINDSINLYALTKRKSWTNAERKRFETIVYPGGALTYDFYVDTFSGDWHRGLRKCFQEHKLYDVRDFNAEMYQRKDLQWIRHAKMMHLMMAWDQKLFDRIKDRYVLKDFIDKSKSLYGGDDVIGIWPTWPALGMDQRNQWDMYRDIPGGLKGLRTLVDQAHDQRVKIFISYNPWDESTRKEDHLQGMADLIKALNADGVILDTRGASSRELQDAADRVKPGVIMYSEGMAVPKDMNTILAGRVHNALYYPPILNLNKLIQPDFAIFRVAEVYKEPIRREIHTALFNGYGIEFNLFHPGNPSWLDEQYAYLGRALKILREHTTNFNSKDWQPLYPSLRDSVYINYWPGTSKDIYTIYNSLPSGYSGELFEIKPVVGHHYIDIWNHKEISINKKPNGNFISVDLDPYPLKELGSNNEGSVSVVAGFDSIIGIKSLPLNNYFIAISRGTHILVWPGNPDYT